MFLPFELTLRPSRIYRAILLLAHGLAAIGIWLAALPLWLKCLMTAMLIAGAIWLMRKDAGAARGLRVPQSGLLEVLENEWQAASMRGQPVVLPWLVSLVLAGEDGRLHLLMLWPDSADADALRKLRVWLRWGRHPLSGASL